MNRRSIVLLGVPLALGMAAMTAPLHATGTVAGAAAVPAGEQGPSAKPRKKPKRFCLGKRATIVGNKKANRILGTSGRDVIWAGRGADTIISLGGRDRVCGGAGADALVGGKGKDRLSGGKQRDFCWGEEREHSLHFGCDVHLNLRGLRTKPERTKAPAALTARTAPTVQAVRAADPPASARRAGNYFDFQQPVCEVGFPWSMIHLGEVYFRTYYTNPGWIAIAPVYWEYSSGGFVSGAMIKGSSYENTGGWAMVSAPADGQVYKVSLQPFQIYKDAVRRFVGYDVYWHNGSSWVDRQFVYAPQTHLKLPSGLAPTGPLCMIGW